MPATKKVKVAMKEGLEVTFLFLSQPCSPTLFQNGTKLRDGTTTRLFQIECYVTSSNQQNANMLRYVHAMQPKRKLIKESHASRSEVGM